MRPFKRKLLSMLLCGALLCSLCTRTAFAEAGETSGASTDGLCEHHTEHDDDCGYTEGKPETPCGHECTDECYETVKECVHEHDGDCYEKVLVCENEDGEHEHDEDCYEKELSCGHECSEESGCITETLNCTHEHDEACGYQPAVEGTPCGYVCALCGADEDSTEPANEKETSLPADDLPDEPEQKDGQKTFTVAQAEAMIDDLPDVEEVKALDPEEDAETLEEIYLQAAEAADAFDTLSDEEQESVSNLDKLMELHEWFNGGVATMSSVDKTKISNSSLYWELNVEGTLTITGNGVMPHWDPKSGIEAPWYSYAGDIKKVSIANGVTSIGVYAFYECSALESIEIPASVTTIGDFAFYECSALESIEIPASVTTIGGNAFEKCTGLKTVTFAAGSGLETLRSGAFYGCSSLTSITIPEGVKTIEQAAFSKCSSLPSITIPEGVTMINIGTFSDCSSLASITIPASVTTIDMIAFSGCAALKTVIFEGTAPPTIGFAAFSGCNNITTICFPPGSEAAYSKLKDVLLPKQSSGSSSRHHHHSSGGGSTAAKTTTSADSSAAKSNSPFTDVSEADWFYPDVAFVYACGLLGGTIDGSFEPYASVSRLSLAELFYRMEGCPAVAGRNNFTDVTYDPDAANDPDAAGAYDAVTWARQSGVLTGFGDGTFRPDSPITREQFAAAFYNYAKYKGYDVSDTGALDTYADGAAVSAWSLDAVNWAVGAGIINSRTDELFAPQAETMNAELAVMLHRFIEKYGLVPVPSPTGDGTVSWIKLPDAAA